MQTHFDEKIGTINLIPQDFGRVLLNLYNNAFYSVTEKKKIAGNEFEPTVSVSTKLISPQGTGKNAKVEIRIRDNGLGVPLRIQDKIFQPFFTSKPTGQGTGLGLSLSYDILTKEHEGTLKLNSQEGEYAEFIISLPLQENA
jgi:signal transduction histidine kinase